MQYVNDWSEITHEYALDLYDHEFFINTGFKPEGMENLSRDELFKIGIGRKFDMLGYFSRKGLASEKIPSDVLEPVYVNDQLKEVVPESEEYAKEQIYDGKLAIAGFRLKSVVSKEKEEEIFDELINAFVRTSQNADFQGNHYSFTVKSEKGKVSYNNAGPEDQEITPFDIKEALGLETSSVKTERLIREFEKEHAPEQKAEKGKDYVLDMENLPELKLGAYSLDLKEHKDMLSHLAVGEKVEIGRLPETEKNIQIPEDALNAQYVSRKHATIEMGEDGQLHLADTSTNGTTILGKAREAEVSEIIQEPVKEHVPEQKAEHGKEYVLDMENLPELKLGAYSLDLKEYRDMLSHLAVGEKVEIGRSPETEKNITISEDELSVSRKHATIEMGKDGQLHLTDPSSTNGTTIIGKAREAEAAEAVQEPVKENVPEQKDLQDRPSEEIILDEMLRAGKLTREQEDKILEMAIFIQEKRAKEKEQGIQSESSYAEQFIDQIKDSKDFSDEQKDIALNAAIKAESMERPEAYDKIQQLRGITTQKSSVGNTDQEASPVKLSPEMQMQAMKDRENG